MTAISFYMVFGCAVRQYGILSPVLFVVCMDDIIVKLNDINNLAISLTTFICGLYMYAYDLILISNLVSFWQKMISIYEQEG